MFLLKWLFLAFVIYLVLQGIRLFRFVYKIKNEIQQAQKQGQTMGGFQTRQKNPFSSDKQTSDIIEAEYEVVEESGNSHPRED